MKSPVTPAQAAAHLLKLASCSETFEGFVRALFPNFTFAPFQIALMTTLDKLEKGDLIKDGRPCYRLMINMPPRHAKSFLASELFPCYYMARKPERHVLATSYNAELAKTFGRQVRNHALDPTVSQAFPNFSVDPTAAAAADWMTTNGGKYFATGIGGSTTGRAANLLITDDPIKARQEAESATYRNNIWSYYLSALLTRKQPEPDGTPAIEILILTRWHPDDIAGRIMETEDWKENDWTHINLDCFVTSTNIIEISRKALPPTDPDYLPPDTIMSKLNVAKRKPVKRPHGEPTALWPERFPVSELKKIERRSPSEFASLYRQSPFIQGGNLIKPKWFNTYNEIPELQLSIFACDTAFGKTQQSDPSVFMHAAMAHGGDIYILNVIRERLDYPSLRRKAISLNAANRGSHLRGFYIEDAASGQSLIQDLRTESGIAVIPYKPGSRDKVARANATLPLIEGGRVFLPDEAPWLDTFLRELEQFPNSKHDDQVDALTMSLEVLSRMSTSTGMSPWHSSLASSNKPTAGAGFSSLNAQRAESLDDYCKRWGE